MTTVEADLPRIQECPYCHKRMRDYDGEFYEHIADCDQRFLQWYEAQHEDTTPYYDYGDDSE